MNKPKKPQAECPEEISDRDSFQTPNYAVDLLVPFLPKNVKIWECAVGQGKIMARLEHYGYTVHATDLSFGKEFNFLKYSPDFEFDIIVTNSPFSIKEKFYKRCIYHARPFALLLPADYSRWIIDAIDKHKCEKIIPTRRVDYITPDILKRIWEGETWNIALMEDREARSMKMKEFADLYPRIWESYLQKNISFCFESIYEVPSRLLRRYSSSQFHSMWLTWGFGIGKTETFVELTNEQKNNI